MNDENREYFLYLNRLRESGVVNMFGATEYICEAFDLPRAEAKSILIEWMHWVEEDKNNRDL